MPNYIFRLTLFIAIILLSHLGASAQSSQSQAAAKRQQMIDSTKAARQKYNDSVTKAREHYNDSVRTAQQLIIDSIKAVRERRADSMASIRAYLKSKEYNDSVALARQHRIDSIKAVRQRVTDSLNAVRQHQADSIAAVREKYRDSLQTALALQRAERERILDSMTNARKRIADSIAARNAYRKSDRYKDSVAAVRKHVLDSMAAVRKAYNDSLHTAQQKVTDSIKAERQKYNDSLHAALEKQRVERQKFIDSLKVIRQHRSDSLAKAKDIREKARKDREKAREKKKKLSLELKIKKEQDAYTNETMRRKKWSVPRRIVQNTITRYNYYFNAHLKMLEAEANMEKAIKEDYSKTIPLYSFDPNKDSSKVASDMDSIIHKGSIGIQLHDPRGKWEDDLYLLVGKAYYYKGDYKNAEAAFKYIIAEAEQERKAKEKAANKGKKKKDKIAPLQLGVPDKGGIAGIIEHKSAKNEALLWLTRTFTQSGNIGASQSLLDILSSDANFPERLHWGLAMQKAFIDIQNNNINSAVSNLSLVAFDKNADPKDRQRAAFLAGQLYEQSHNYDSAQKYYSQTINLKPPFEMEFYARMNIVNTGMQSGNNSENVYTLLHQMIKDPKYHLYYDQLYYALGKYNLSIAKQDEAIKNFQKSTTLNQNNKHQRGLTFYALADVYYKIGNYKNAGIAYDTAAMLLTKADNPEYDRALQLSKMLDYITQPIAIIQQQDSLLHLSSLSEKEQRAAIRKYIRVQERLLKDSAFIASNAVASVAPNNNPNNNVGDWYFSNPVLVQKGSNDFKQKWGNRPLADNWRLSNSSNNNNTNNATTDIDNDNLNSGLDEDSLYALIPHGKEEIAQANNLLEESLFSLGKAYYTYIEDYTKATNIFDTLDAKYPNHKHHAEVLYDRYLMSLRNGNTDKANDYYNSLLIKYPNSDFAQMLQGTANTNTQQTTQKIEQHYDSTYNLLMHQQYTTVIQNANEAQKLFPSEYGHFAKQYNLLKAVAIAGQGNYGKADTMLTEFVKVNPKDSLTEWANNVLLYIRKQKANEPKIDIKNNKDNPTNKPTTLPSIVTINNTNKPSATDTSNNNSNKNTITPSSSNNQEFVYNPNQEHYLLISTSSFDGKLMGVKSGLNDYNNLKHDKEKLSISVTSLQDGRGIIICKKFNDATVAKAYLQEIQKQTLLFRDYSKGEYDIILISPDNLSKLYQKDNYAEYKTFYNQYYK